MYKNNIQEIFSLIAGTFNRLRMTSPFLKFIIVFILLDSLVVGLDDSHLVSFIEGNVGHHLDLLQNGVRLVAAGVHVGLDDERLADVHHLGVHHGLGCLLPALDHVAHRHHASVDDIIVL